MAHHHYHSPARRALYSLGLVVGVMFVGTIGIHSIEKLSYIDAFYFMSMIATSQGPPFLIHSSEGKIFASIMAFVSVGLVVAALGFLFGPFFGKLWRIGVIKLEEELHLIERHKKDGSG